MATASPKVKALESEAEIVRSQITELNNEYNGEEFPEEVAERWNRYNAQLEDVSKKIELIQRQERVEAISKLPGNTEDISADFQVGVGRSYRGDPFDLSTIERSFDPEKEGIQFKDRVRKVIERDDLHFRQPGISQDDAKEVATKMVEEIDHNDGRIARHMLANGGERYRKAFGKVIAGQFLNTEDAHSIEMSRALSLTSAAGGYAVPTELDPTIIPTSNLTINPFRGISRVVQVTVDNWNGVSSGAVTAAYAGEATPTTDSSPTLAQVAISTERASSFIPFSIEIGQDWGALQGEMAKLLQDAKDTLEATKFTVGSGSSEPFGVITGATTLYTAASTTALAVADLYGLEVALPPRFRRNASMLFTRAVAQKLRGFDTGTGAGSGSNVWIDNLRSGVSNNSVPTPGGYNANVLGYPAYESVDMSSTFTTGQKLIVIGDFNYYIIIDRIGMNIEVIQHLFDVTNNQPTGQRGLYAYWRNGAKVADPAAFRTLRLA